MGGRFVESLYNGSAFQGFHYDEILYEGRTPYQSIAIYATRGLGRVLVLDDIIQTTEADEFIYHEMLAHVPLFACERPERVLVVGGGDGGTLREVLRHPVQAVDMCEIDREVIDRCIEFLPFLNDGGAIYDDPRVTVVVDDAFEYMKRAEGAYDVIIVDSTDPIGAAEALFSEPFYRLCQAALSPRGVLSAQNGVVFFQRDEAANAIAAFRRLGLEAACYIAAVPMYYGGEMTFGIAARAAAALSPATATLRERYDAAGFSTRHYTPDVHAAAFVLPPWIDDLVEGTKT